MYSTKIKVQYKSGSPVQGVKVVLSISGLMSGGITKTVFSDYNGDVIINHTSKGNAKLIVNGSTKATIKVPTNTVVFL